MFLLSRLLSRAPQVMATFLIFSLASGILGGILFYMDSVGPDVFADMTEDVPVDMEIHFTYQFYRQNETTVADVMAVVHEQDAVIAAENVKVVEYWDWSEEEWYYDWGYIMGMDMAVFETFPDVIQASEDAPPLTSSTCYVEKGTLVRRGLSIGDNFTVTAESYLYNGTHVEVTREFEITGTFETEMFRDYYWDIGDVTLLRMITSTEGINENFGDLGGGEWQGISDRIWVGFDHDAVLQADPSIAAENLDNARKRIEQAVLPYAVVGWSGFGLLDSVIEYQSWSIMMRVIALSFSVPSIVMGIMLIQYNTKLLEDERRRNVGTIKTRGSSGWQAFRWVLSSALLVGVLGSTGAIAVGALSALVSGTVRTLLTFDLSRLSEFSLFLSPEALAIVFSFSFVVGLLVSLPPAVKALLMTPTEAHSEIEREVLLGKENLGNVGIDIAATILSGYALMPMFMILSYPYYSLISVVYMLATMLPFFVVFMVAAARLLSRPMSAIKAKVLDRFRRMPLVVGSRLMSRSVTLFKKSEAMGAMFVAMVFAAGMFSSISATTAYTHTEELFYFQVGGDISVNVKSAATNITIDLLSSVTEVPGIAEASGMFEITAYMGYYQAYSYGASRLFQNVSVTVFGVQPELWIDTGYWLPYFTYEDSPLNSLSAVSSSNATILTDFKPLDHYAMNNLGQIYPVYSSSATLYFAGYNGTWVNDVTIQDVVSSTLEDYGVNYLPGELNAQRFVVMNLEYLHEVYNTTRISKINVKLEAGANYTSVIQELWALSPSSFSSIECARLGIEGSLDTRASQTVYGVYTLNMVFSLMFLTMGMTLVATIRIRNLRKQLSVLRALGADRRSLVVPILIDVSVGIIIAALIGTIIGVLLTVLIINIPLAFIGTSTASLWTRLPVFMVVPGFLVVGVIAASFLFSLGSTYVVTARNLRKNIAEEIQYLE
ncbi:MAG: FtsX-like permease family protein [Candidatus Thorarchaeota archaeon]|nr:MAG: FtsX-like permease family protein [Candidatus Thorarchaeota archaeon]